MTRIDKIGTSYCLNEIRLAGKQAQLAQDPSEKNWDIEVLDEKTKKIIRIQVQTLNWLAEIEGKVRVNFIEHDLDYLIIVLLNFNREEFSSLVIPRTKLKQKGKGDIFKLIDENKCVYYVSRTDQEQHTYQTIDITPLKYDDMRTKFACYKNAFASIKNLPVKESAASV